MPSRDPGFLPGALFGFGFFSRYFVSLTSAAFGTNNDHIFPKLGCDVNTPRILSLGLTKTGSPKHRLRWRPFLSVIAEGTTSMLKILTKTSGQLLVLNF